MSDEGYLAAMQTAGIKYNLKEYTEYLNAVCKLVKTSGVEGLDARTYETVLWIEEWEKKVQSSNETAPRKRRKKE